MGEECVQEKKKSRTCEEGRGTPLNFFLKFIDELEKQIIIIKKNCWIGPIKDKKQFNIYNVVF